MCMLRPHGLPGRAWRSRRRGGVGAATPGRGDPEGRGPVPPAVHERRPTMPTEPRLEFLYTLVAELAPAIPIGDIERFA